MTARETEGIDCHVLTPLAFFGVQSMTRYVRLLFFLPKRRVILALTALMLR